MLGDRVQVHDPDPALAGEQRAELLERAVRRGFDFGKQEVGMRLDPYRKPIAAARAQLLQLTRRPARNGVCWSRRDR